MASKSGNVELSIDKHPKIAKLFGQIVARWAHVDDLLAHILGFMLDGKISQAETILYSLGNFKSRLDIVRNVVTDHLADPSAKPRILSLLKRIERLSRTRNMYIHNLSMGSATEMLHMQRRPGTKQPFAILPLKEIDLKQHMLAVNETIIEMIHIRHTFMLHLYTALPRTSPEKPAERHPRS